MQSSNKSPTLQPKRIFHCGHCGEPGHTKKSCANKKLLQLKIESKEDAVDDSTPNLESELSPKFENEGGATKNGSDAEAPASSQSRQSDGEVGVEAGQPQKSCLSQNVEKEFTAEPENQPKSSDSKEVPPEVKTNKGTGSGAKHCSLCNGTTLDKRKCPRKKQEPEEEDCLNRDALRRLSKGMTEKDGPGYIYMYMKSKPETEADNSWFKIGLSEHLPERRIHQQELKNKVEYTSLWSGETPCRKLAESVIFKQLKDFHAPKESGDGKTEWFMGDRSKIMETVKQVVRECRIWFENQQRDCEAEHS